MNWNNRLATRNLQVRSSIVREFLKLAGQPGYISFAGGFPDPALLPTAEIQAATEAVFAQYGSRALQYGETQGLPELRATIAKRFGSPTALPENVLITSGSQQALDLLGRVLLDEGTRVLVQNPTYLSALAAWGATGARFHHVHSAADTVPGVAFAYLNPTFQNPTGLTLPLLERLRLLESLGRREIPIVEDDPYRELRYEGQALPSLFEISGGVQGEQVISVGSLSKIIAPGLRLGWIIAPIPLIEALVRAKQALDLHTSTLAQLLALQLLDAGFLEIHLPRLRDSYRRKRDRMLSSLKSLDPRTANWSNPHGGMFVFLTLNASVSAKHVARVAVDHRLLVVPGDDFHIDGRGQNTLRLNFSHPNLAEIQEGVSRLTEALSEAEARCQFPADQ